MKRKFHRRLQIRKQRLIVKYLFLSILVYNTLYRMLLDYSNVPALNIVKLLHRFSSYILFHSVSSFLSLPFSIKISSSLQKYLDQYSFASSLYYSSPNLLIFFPIDDIKNTKTGRMLYELPGSILKNFRPHRRKHYCSPLRAYHYKVLNTLYIIYYI